MFKLILVSCLVLFANANELSLSSGKIQAHTEVFGDTSINPYTKEVSATLKKDSKIESIRGIFQIKTKSLISDNKKRDLHMYEVLKVEQSPKITFTITNILRDKNFYKIQGVLEMNHIKKDISSLAKIEESDKNINMKGSFSINLNNFDIKPPSMFFLTVRAKIDIKYNFDLKEI